MRYVPVSSGSCCLILASEEKARELSDTPVWIKAMSCISDTYMVGYRDFLGFPMLKKLAQKVYQEAGITKPLEEIDYAEVFNPFAGFEYLQYDALGFCEAMARARSWCVRGLPTSAGSCR